LVEAITEPPQSFGANASNVRLSVRLPAGSVHATLKREVEAAVTITAVGAAGRVVLIEADVGVLCALSPVPFVAVVVKQYDVPSVRPGMTAVVVTPPRS